MAKEEERNEGGFKGKVRRTSRKSDIVSEET